VDGVVACVQVSKVDMFLLDKAVNADKLRRRPNSAELKNGKSDASQSVVAYLSLVST